MRITYVVLASMGAACAQAAPTPAAAPPAPATAKTVESAPPPASSSASPDGAIVIESDPSKLETKHSSAGLKSYEQALKTAVAEEGAETLSAKECAEPLSGAIAATCNLHGKATAKVAIRKGKLIGLTVTLEPHDPAVQKCMSDGFAGATWRAVPGISTCTRAFASK